MRQLKLTYSSTLPERRRTARKKTFNNRAPWCQMLCQLQSTIFSKQLYELPTTCSLQNMLTSTIFFWDIFLYNHKIKVQNILINIEENGNSLGLSQEQCEWPWSRQDFGFERNCRPKLGFSCFQSNEAAWNSRKNIRSFHKRKGKLQLWGKRPFESTSKSSNDLEQKWF